MKIRFLKEKDFSHGFIECLEMLGKTPVNMSDMMVVFQQRKKHGIKTFVVEEKVTSKIIGSASLILEPKFRYLEKCGHLEDVCVVGTHQNQGIGKKLVSHVLNYAKVNKCYKVILNCTEENYTFYNKLGFKKHEHGLRIDLT
jgi:glucosamine-phosphate N-acetyltransferase